MVPMGLVWWWRRSIEISRVAEVGSGVGCRVIGLVRVMLPPRLHIFDSQKQRRGTEVVEIVSRCRARGKSSRIGAEVGSGVGWRVIGNAASPLAYVWQLGHATLMNNK